MSIQSIVFAVIAVIAVFAMPDKMQHFIGLFAIGWMFADIGMGLFPKKEQIK